MRKTISRVSTEALKEFILDNYKNYGINGSNRYAAANNVQAFVDGGGMQTAKNANGGYDFKAGSGYNSLLNPQAASGTSYTSSGTSSTGSSYTQTPGLLDRGVTLLHLANGGSRYVYDDEVEKMLENGTAYVSKGTAKGEAVVYETKK